MVWYSHLFQNFPQFSVIHTVKGFGIVKAEVDVFLEPSCFFDDLMDARNLISASTAFSKTSSNIWNSQFTYRCSLTWRIWSITLLMCEMSAIVQYFEHSLTLPFFGIGMKIDLSCPVATAEFSKFADILSEALSKHYLLGVEIAQPKSHHLQNKNTQLWM